MELAQRHRIEIHLDDRFFGTDPGMVGKARTQHKQQVALVHTPAGHRGAAATEHPGRQRMIVRDLPFRLEGGQHRRLEFVRQLQDVLHGFQGTVPDDDDRPFGVLQALQRVGQAVDRRQHATVAEPAVRRSGLCLLIDGQRLHLVREDQVRHVALDDRGLARQIHQLDRIRVTQNSLAESRHRRIGAGQVDLLERTGPKHLGVHLPGQRQNRRAVDLGVPKPGQHIGRTRSRDAHTGRWPSRQLGVTGRGKGRRPFMTNANVLQPAILLLQAQGVAQAEIGMPDHAEHMGHTPIDHGLGHHVAERRSVARRFPHRDIDAVIAPLDRVGLDPIVMRAG